MSDRRITVVLTLALVAALATSALASCMAGPAMTADSQMACCQGAHRECGTRGVADQCCKTDSQKQQQFVVARHEVVSAPALLDIAVAAAEFAANQIVPVRRLVPSPHPITSRSAPTYLLDSAFLI